ncbi:SOS response-associated peptidase [Ectopseudomonas guguanensis]|uniref:SOS response-associated peptidase n=1 Tax=Ectopseudomonas guguanensis TaxID=1198456 RepID=UPI0028B1B746|nr:SOS response-associated peptidase [Pseudomonas guguanensis]
MCGRYVSPDDRAIEQYWHIGARNSGQWIRRYNVAPSTQVPLLRRNPDGQLELDAGRWGLVPHWWNKPALPGLSFNARSEEAASKPMWRQAIRAQRCIMPSLGWYEWNEQQKVRNRAGRQVNQPYYHHAADESPLAIAGLWSSWSTPDGQQLLSCALLTKEAAGPVAAIHHRMPVILAPEQFDLWLSPASSLDQAMAVIAASRQDFEVYPVTTDVGNTRNDYPELLEPVEVV